METMGRAENLRRAAEACAVLAEAMARLHAALIALGKDTEQATDSGGR